MISAKFTPDARTRMRTSPRPGTGSAASRGWSTSGGPCRVMTICRNATLTVSERRAYKRVDFRIRKEGGSMRKLVAGFVGAAFIVALAAPAFAKTETVKGRIVDESCYTMDK